MVLRDLFYEKSQYLVVGGISCSSGSVIFSMKCRFSLLFVSSLWVAMCMAIEGLIKLPRNETIPAVIAFGDSIVDAGNNNNLPSPSKCNFPPYGRDFYGGIPTGRFSNGKVPSDLIAEELGIKELLPPYMDPNLRSIDLLTGVTFASGGSGYDPLTPALVSATSLSEQLIEFKEYIGRLKRVVGEERTSFTLAKSLVAIVSGSNDIGNTYFGSGIRRLEYDIPSYTDLMLNSAASFLGELYKLEVRRIGVFSIPAIGCVPALRTLGGGLQRQCSEEANEAAKLFNSKLSSQIHLLRQSLPLAKIVYIDIYNPLLDIIKNPRKFGFEIANKGCCGTGTVEASILCNGLEPGTCRDDSKYVFWDAFHPTERAYKILVSQLLNKYVNSFF